MTEQEWLTCTDPDAMLSFLHGKVSDRKLRLFACACCRQLGHRLDDRGRALIDVAEKRADGLLSKRQRRHIFGRLGGAGKFWGAPSCAACDSNAFGAARNTFSTISQNIADTAQSYPDNADSIDACGLLRDIFGSFFRRVIISRVWLSWNDCTVPRLAEAIYDDRAFDRLPILADALEEAGCDNADILNHCRQPGEHALGCWVVDLLLGKS